jgi:hypothetical protein
MITTIWHSGKVKTIESSNISDYQWWGGGDKRRHRGLSGH